MSISKRLGLQIIRSRWTIPYLVMFPLFFIGIYWFGFSTSDIGNNQTFEIGILNNDTGFGEEFKSFLTNQSDMEEWFPHSEKVITEGFALEFIDLAKELKYENKTDAKYIFNVTEIHSQIELDTQLKNRELDIALIIPEDFSNATLASVNNFWFLSYGMYFQDYFNDSTVLFPINVTTTLEIVGDESYVNFIIAKSILTTFLSQYLDLSTYFGVSGGSFEFKLNDMNTIQLSKYTFFELMVPGLIMFGIIIQPSLFSSFLCNEFRPENKTIERLLISPISSSNYVIGSLIIQLPVMILQTIILFVSSLALGFQPEGNIYIGFFLCCLLFPFSASITYLTAAFFSNEDVAGTVTGFGAPILGFMSGAFVEIPEIVLIQNGIPLANGMFRDFLLWDLLPLTHGVNAIKKVLLYDFSIDMIFYDVLSTIILSLFYLFIFILIFIYFRFRRVRS
jgi:ABC-2 type transport system permease protein